MIDKCTVVSKLVYHCQLVVLYSVNLVFKRLFQIQTEMFCSCQPRWSVGQILKLSGPISHLDIKIREWPFNWKTGNQFRQQKDVFTVLKAFVDERRHWTCCTEPSEWSVSWTCFLLHRLKDCVRMLTFVRDSGWQTYSPAFPFHLFTGLYPNWKTKMIS